MSAPWLRTLEAKRKRAVLHFLTLGGAFIPLLFGSLSASAPPWLFFISPLALLVGLLVAEAFREEVRRQLVEPLVEAQGFRFNPGEGLKLEELLWTGFLPPWPNYQTEDLVEGRMAGCPFRASRLVVRLPAPLGGGGWILLTHQRGTVYQFRLPRGHPKALHLRAREWGTGPGMLFFSGVFLALALLVLGREWPEGKILFVGALLLLGGWGVTAWDWLRVRRALQAKAPPLESFFRVYGKGPLDPSLAQVLVELRRALGRPFHLTLEGERLALFLQGELLQPSLFQPLPVWLAKAEARWKEEVSALEGFLESALPVLQPPK